MQEKKNLTDLNNSNQDKIDSMQVKLNNFEQNQKWMEKQLVEAEEIRKRVENEYSLALKKIKKTEKILNEERSLAEQERNHWLEKEKKLATDLKKAQQNVNIQRRKTVSVSPSSRLPVNSMYLKDMDYTKGFVARRNIGNQISNDVNKNIFPGLPDPNYEILKEDSYEILNSWINQIENSEETEERVDQRVIDSIAKLQSELAEYKRSGSVHLKARSDMRNQIEKMDKMFKNTQLENKQLLQKIMDLETNYSQQQEIIENLRDENESYRTLIQMQSISGKFTLNSYGNSYGNDSKLNTPTIEQASIGDDNTKSKTKLLSTDINSNPENTNQDWATHYEEEDYNNSNSIFSGKKTKFSNSLSLDQITESHGEQQGLNLGAELEISNKNSVSDGKSKADLESENLKIKDEIRVLKIERSRLLDESKATALYINRILTGVLSMSGGLEAVLDKDFDSSKVNRTNNSEDSTKQNLAQKEKENIKNQQQKPARTFMFGGFRLNSSKSEEPNPTQRNTISNVISKDGSETKDLQHKLKDNSAPVENTNMDATNNTLNPIYNLFGSSNNGSAVENKTAAKIEEKNDIEEPVIPRNKNTDSIAPAVTRQRAKTMYGSTGNWWNKLSQRFVVTEKDGVVMPEIPLPTKRANP
ncbi:hypothetical protein BB559_005534 [Furculomyces boomerangus]|nr:hypothetical protein BB559_005534 [Furculomyces boomerangus]PWA01163.1 hypothetical protein BB558_002738 [Smittium angustum]